MKYTPHAYQQTAINFLLEHDRGALFLDMGLGKTSITLTALAKLHEQATMGRVLIVAPLRVAQTTWPQELSKWDHLAPLKDAYAVACGPVAKRKAAVESGKPITIINRENLAWLAKNYPWTWDTVIIDELSSFKNHKAARFRVLRGALPKIRRMWGLTGTPTPNGLIDLWAQYRLIDAGQRLGKNIGSYRNEFFLPDKRNAVQVFTWKPRPGADQEIYSRIGDVTLSMQAKDHLDLPALTIVDRTLELPPAAQATYDQLSRE